MSISTLESPASRRALDSYHAERDASAAAENKVRSDVKTAFNLLGIVPAERIALPAVDNAKQREGAVTLRRAVLELIQEGHCDDELMAVIERGTGDLVDALQVALRDTYAERTASDVAAFRV